MATKSESVRYFVICQYHTHLLTWAKHYKVNLGIDKATFIGSAVPGDVDRLRGIDWSKPNIKLVETGPVCRRSERLQEELQVIKARYNVQPEFQPT